MARNEIGAIILAAGEGARFRAAGGEGSKLLAHYQGKALVRHVAEAALSAWLAGVIVVTGHEASAIRAALNGLPITFVANEDYASGMGSSLRMGFAARPATWKAAVILLGDMPLVDAALIGQVADAYTEDVSAVVPTFEGVRGNPVLLSARLAPEIAALSGDMGARQILRGREDVRDLPVTSAAARLDIDTPEALKQL
jgi:molybdenum cofactor cytidylyltransferase